MSVEFPDESQYSRDANEFVRCICRGYAGWRRDEWAYSPLFIWGKFPKSNAANCAEEKRPARQSFDARWNQWRVSRTKFERQLSEWRLPMGWTLVDVEFTGRAKERVLRVTLEKNAEGRAKLKAAIEAGAEELPERLAEGKLSIEQLSGITHEDCAEFSRDFGVLLDMEDLVPGAEYTLEASSPGLDRKLTRPEEFQEFCGQPGKGSNLRAHPQQSPLAGQTGSRRREFDRARSFRGAAEQQEPEDWRRYRGDRTEQRGEGAVDSGDLTRLRHRKLSVIAYDCGRAEAQPFNTRNITCGIPSSRSTQRAANSMASALYQSIELLSREKGIEPQIVVGAVEEAIALATRKYYKTQENMRGELNKETGEITAYIYKTVVPDEEQVEDPVNQITLAEANELAPGSKSAARSAYIATPARWAALPRNWPSRSSSRKYVKQSATRFSRNMRIAKRKY